MTECLCLSCKREGDCEISKRLRASQMELLGSKFIWDKVFMRMEVTHCLDYQNANIDV